jgi:glycosyltransferase involved in cell wall biosynthesis
MIRLSAVVITKNEEDNIRRCLESIRFADEIIIIDSGSIDKTIEIAESFNARVYSPEWQGFGNAKRAGVDKSDGDWILSIDADEEVTETLAAEIQAVIGKSNGASGYYVKRKTKFLGRWILHCGWYPDYVLRLFQKSSGTFDNAIVHEKVVTNGPVAYLKGELLHYSYPNLEHYLIKFNRYTTMGAEEAFLKGRRAGLMDIVIKPAASFVKHYLLKQGYRDGVEGFVLSSLSSMSVMVKYAKLRQLWKEQNKER